MLILRSGRASSYLELSKRNSNQMLQESLMFFYLLKASVILVLIIFSSYIIFLKEISNTFSSYFSWPILKSVFFFSLCLMILPSEEKERENLRIFSFSVQCSYLQRKDFFHSNVKLQGPEGPTIANLKQTFPKQKSSTKAVTHA